MRNNKILTVAIASALSLGAGSVYGVTLQLVQPGTAGVAGATDLRAGTPVPVVTFASELFPAGIVATPTNAAGTTNASGAATAFTVAAGSGDDSFIVQFRPQMSTALADTAQSIIVKATLSNSATWGAEVVPAQLQYCANASVTLPVVAVDSCGLANASHPVQISKGSLLSKADNSDADFVIQKTTAKFNASDYIYFAFDVNDLASFEKNGSLSLTMEAWVTASGFPNQSLGSQTIEIARSVNGLTIDITPNTDPQTIVVDVAQAYKKFIIGANSATAVSLGNLKMATNTAKPKTYNGSLDFSLAGFGSKKATFTVTDGIFSASKAANAVFLDLNDNATFDTGTDIAGTVQNDSTAKWELTSANIDAIVAKGTSKVTVAVDGTTDITTRTVAPTGTLVMYMTGAGTGTTYTGKLRHIKDNGLKCTLYNVPDGTPGRGSLDGVSIRFTNKSATVTGNVYGELFDESGKSIYGSRKTLITGVAPLATVRLNSGEGGDLDLTFGQYNWAGQRARLLITSDLQDAEIFALVRNTQGGPNMNVSTGATGNGCIE